jgi:8-oxo-dGTP diphosphatase
LKKNPTLLLVVAAALVRDDGAILLQKRPEGRAMAGLWEFPGGKLEHGEPPELALARELTEELAITVDPADLHAACFASEPLGERNLLLILYTCRNWSGAPQPVEGQQLGWFGIDEMDRLRMPPADIPLIALLRKVLTV